MNSGKGGIARISDYDGPALPGKIDDRTISQMPGWPIALDAEPPYLPIRGLLFADLDGDGYQEIITSSTDRKIYAWDYQGALMPGFPSDLEHVPQEAPSVGDLDGDGDLEIVQCTHSDTFPSGGDLSAIDHEGNPLPGFPVTFNGYWFTNSPTLVDLDDDGDLEILATEGGWRSGRLHVVEHDGTAWGGNWPFRFSGWPECTPGVADVDNDGRLEIACVAGDRAFYLLDRTGVCLPGWPRHFTNCYASYEAPAFADLDGDGDLEILIGLGGGSDEGCYVFNHDGTDFPGWPKMVGTTTYCQPTVTDLEGDGELDILFGRMGVFWSYSDCFWAWTASGDTKAGFPYGVSWGGGTDGPITVADINDDGRMEIFADHNAAELVEDTLYGFLFGVDSNGNDLPGFPLRPKGFTHMNGATIGDVDGDGDYELGLLTISIRPYEFSANVNLYDLTECYHPSRVDWETLHGRNERGGLYQSGDRLHEQGYVASGNTIKLIIHDEPGTCASLWVSLGLERLKHPDFGWFYLNRTQGFFKLLDERPFSPEEEITVDLTIPPHPGLIGRPVYFQGLTGHDLKAGQGQTTNLLRRVIQ